MKVIISGELQRDVRMEINKVYPVGNLEIRKTEIRSSMPVAEKRKRKKKEAKEEKEDEGTKPTKEVKEEK
jgi:ribosomal protein S3AE